MSRNVVSVVEELPGLTSTAIRTALGTRSCSRPNRLATISADKKLMPVALPSGRARLATRPSLTGSSATPKTIGIVVVAALAARAPVPKPGVTITATRLRTSSAMSAGRRSYWPSSQWYSTITFWPSTKPASLRALRNTAPKRAELSDDRPLTKPKTGIGGCCARAAIGHAAAPPTSVMNSRRLIVAPRGQNHAPHRLTVVRVLERGERGANCDQLFWAGNVGFESHDRGQNRKSSKSANVFRFAPRKRIYLPILELLPPPAFGERPHRGLARHLVAVHRLTIFVGQDGPQPWRSNRGRCCFHDAADRRGRYTEEEYQRLSAEFVRAAREGRVVGAEPLNGVGALW